ncbi:Inositol 1,4,5trisphosphate receptor type 2 [Thraustotheca clavata]|uniref:Inositol 1,4,5trisphosphate receptor type 2 n=1 Tax=Thraustotheca clavata TaxID=74557 RepID=A0A1V9ZVX3_9STRA|nr:Inositol 1,4,5trisphosphate receptor type 2 [Thraustotheca clavata]
MQRKREPNALYEGDLVYLNVQDEGHIHSDGFVDERVGCLEKKQAHAATFEGCIFRVVPKLSYEVSKSFKKFTEQSTDAREKIELLQQQVKVEHEANLATIRHIGTDGQLVVYGQTIQLQHVISGKFLTAKAKTLADVDKSSMKITLQEHGSTKCYFTFLPRYKTRSVGSTVVYQDSVCLVQAKYTNHFVHLSASTYPQDTLWRKEINMNYKESILQIIKYSESIPATVRTLQVGNLYRLFHLEGQAYVSMSANPHSDKSPYLRQILPDTNYTVPVNFTLKSLFVLERLDAKEGGPVVNFDEIYRFRHLATGKYLALANTTRSGEVSLTGASHDSESLSSHFCLRPTLGNNGLTNSAHLSFRIETVVNAMTFRLHNPNRAKVNHSMKQKASFELVASTNLLDEDCFRLVEATNVETYEANFLLSVLEHLQRYKRDLKQAFDHRQRITHHLMTDQLTALKALVRFLQKEASQATYDLLLFDGVSVFHRQEQVREIKLIDTLYEILRSISKYGVSYHQLATDPMLKVVHRIHRLVNQVLVYTVNDNIANKNYIAKRSSASFNPTSGMDTPYIQETLGYIGSETGSKSVYRSLFLNNKQLLEESVDLDLIKSSCRNIEAKGIKAYGILHFLSTICSCNNQNLPRNQELIVRVLYSLTNLSDMQSTRYNILIEACECPNPVRPVSPAVKDFVVSAPSGANNFAHNGHPIGSTMLSKGYVNIVVSWKSCNNWALGSNALYYTPEELELKPVVDAAMSNDLAQYDQLVNATHREWILLEHITWTLQPDDIFPLVYNGKAWADEYAEIQKDHEKLETFDRLKALANYYNLQLTLLAELLRGGCVTSLEILSKQFSYNMLVSAVANPCLPHIIRTSFSSILHLCWLARFPHEPMLVPRYVYSFDDIPQVDKQAPPALTHFELKAGHPALSSDDEFIAYPFADKFAFIQGVMHEIMMKMAKDKLVLSAIDANVFLSSLLVMIQWLVQCGFYPEMESFERLLAPLIRLLDGRNTLYANSSSTLLGAASIALVDDTARYNSNKLNQSMTKVKMQICQICQAINVIWRNFEVLKLLSHFKYDNHQEAALFINDEEDESPRKKTKKNIDESKALVSKKENKFLQVFAKGTMDMRAVVKLPLTTICMDLMMYEDDLLVREALSLMIQMHTRREQVLGYLAQCLLIRPHLTSARISSLSISSCQVLKEMEYLVPLFKHYIQSFESPSLCDQMCDVNKVPLGYVGVARLLTEILKKLQEFCADRNAATDTRDPNAEKQTILLQLKIYQDVMQLLCLSMTFLETKYKNDLVNVKRECCIFFQRVMAKNPMGQRIIFPYLPQLTARFEEVQNIGDVLIAIFVENRELCSSIPEDAIWTTMKLLNDLVGQLDSTQTDSALTTAYTILNFFTHYMIPDQVPMKTNQTHLFKVLTHPQFTHIILPFNHGIEENMEVSSVNIMTTDGYMGLQELVRTQKLHDRLLYFQKSLELLSIICRGKTYKTEVECQQIYPLNFILTLILDPEMPLPLKVVAGKFLAEVFFDTDLEVDPKICVMPAVWNVLLHCSTQIAAYNAFLYKEHANLPLENTMPISSSHTYDELARYVFEGNMAIVTSFFNCVYNPNAEDLDENTIHIVQALKSDIRSLKKRGKLDEAQREICDYCGAALGIPLEKKPLAPLKPLKPANLRRAASTNSNSSHHRNAIVRPRNGATIQEALGSTSSFDQYKWSLIECSDVVESINDEFQELVTALETIESLTDKAVPVDGNASVLTDGRANTITMQLLCTRIMKFIADNPTSSCAVYTIEALLRVISSKHLSEDDKRRLQTAEIEEAQETYQNTQTFMASCGAARLILTLIANGYNASIMLKAIEFGVQMINGGNLTVQTMLYEGMKDSDERFFVQIDRILQNAIEEVKELRRTIKYISGSYQTTQKAPNPTATAAISHDGKPTDNILAFALPSDTSFHISGDILVKFLSLLAEGHNLNMQLVMLDQTYVGNAISVNILQTVTSYLAILVKDELQLQNMTARDCSSLNACWLFLSEYMQGPCSQNQEFLTGSIMVEIFRKTLKAQINVMNKDDPSTAEFPTAEAIKELKSNAVKTMVSLLEGRKNDRVEVRLRSTLELKSIKMRLLEVYEQFNAEKHLHIADVTWDERFLEEGVNLFTLAMCVFRASESDNATAKLKDEEQLAPESTKSTKAPRRGDYASEAAFKAAKVEWRHKSMYAKAYNFFEGMHCSIEIWWGNGDTRLDRVYFPLHSHCQMFEFLGNKKDRMLNEFDYKTNERLKQFVAAAAELDEEMQHIELLSNFRLYNIIRPYIPLFKSLSFLLAIFMNLIMLVAFQHDSESLDYHFVPKSLKQPMEYFGILQIFLSTAVLVFMLVISVPLVFRARLNAMIKNSLDSYNAIRDKRKLESMEFDLADLRNGIDINQVGKRLKSGLRGLQSTAQGLGLTLLSLYQSYFPLLRMILLIYLLQFTLLQAFPNFPNEVPFVILFLPFVRNTRHYLETSCGWTGLVYTFVYDVICDKHTAFYTVYLGTAFCATLYHPIFYGYHLLDLVIMSPSLQNVVRAVTKPGRALALTCLLGLFVIYFYTMVLFFYTPSDATDNDEHIPYCSTMIDCFVFFVHRGLLSGGGIGDFLTNGLNHPPNFHNRSAYWLRIFFDLTFFVLVIVLLLNIIFGITIDTFGELRTEANEKEGLMKNQCFICGHSRETFDNHYLEQGISDGFFKHIKEEHNM